jgi:hypothetical protein
MVTLWAKKLTSQPLPQSWPTNKRECWKWFGKILAYLADIVSAGMSTVAVCVDRMKSPFGSLTSIGFTAIYLFTHGTSNARKFPVAPESKIAIGDVFSEGVELR